MNIMNLSTTLETIYFFINQGHYEVAIKEMMSLIEQILRNIYKDIFHSLRVDIRESILNYEKEKKKSIDKMSLGELIGLFRNNSILKEYESINNKKFLHFNLNNLNLFTQIRNKCTHTQFESSKFEAMLIYYTLRMILVELGHIQSDFDVRKEFINGGIEIKEPLKKEIGFDSLTADLKYEKIFEDLMKKVNSKKPILLSRTAPRAKHFGIAVGITDFHIEWLFRGRAPNKEFEIGIHLEKSKRYKANYAVFDFIKNKKELLEEFLNESIKFKKKWLQDGKWSKIYIVKQIGTLESFYKNEDSKLWAVNKMLAFYDFFKQNFNEITTIVSQIQVEDPLYSISNQVNKDSRQKRNAKVNVEESLLRKVGSNSMEIAKSLIMMAKEIDNNIKHKFTIYRIPIETSKGQCIWIRPRVNDFNRVTIKVNESRVESVKSQLERLGLFMKMKDYSGFVKIDFNLTKDQLDQHKDFIRNIFQQTIDSFS